MWQNKQQNSLWYLGEGRGTPFQAWAEGQAVSCRLELQIPPCKINQIQVLPGNRYLSNKNNKPRSCSVFNTLYINTICKKCDWLKNT